MEEGGRREERMMIRKGGEGREERETKEGGKRD